MTAPTAPPPAPAPLREIEALVLDRARAEAAGGSVPDERIGTLVREEVDAWQRAHQRGDRPLPIADPDEVVERAIRNLTGYGPLGPLLADPDVWEVMVNAPAEVFVKRHLGPDTYHHECFHDDEHVVRTITKVLADAGASHRALNPAAGLQDARLSDGSRLHIVHRDLTRGGHLVVNVRKFATVAYQHLDQLVERSMLTAAAASMLQACVAARASVLFAGSPGSGKTTLLSCCCAALDPSLRVVVAEEVFEADVPVPNTAQLQVRPARPDRDGVDLRRLVAGFLRMAPDVAIVGEVRDREALPLLLTLSSGVKGFTTIHAGSARQALGRLRFLAQLEASATPAAALDALIADAIDVVVHTHRSAAGPEVTEIIAVEDGSTGTVGTFTTTTVFSRPRPDAPLEATGHVPLRLARRLGVDPALWGPPPGAGR